MTETQKARKDNTTTTTPATPTWEQDGVQIRVDPRSGKFVFQFDEDEDNTTSSDTLEDARNKIIKRVDYRERQTREKLSLKVISEEGKEHTITGIHSGHYSLLATPKMDRYDRSNLYADVPRVKELLDEEERIVKSLDLVRNKLAAYKVAYSTENFKSYGVHGLKDRYEKAANGKGDRDYGW